MEMKFDKWQRKVLDYKGSVTIRCGRQVGKSTTIGKKAADNMIAYPGTTSLIIAPAQRQSGELFKKAMSWLMVLHEDAILKAGGFKSNPLHSMKKNMENKRLFEHIHGIFKEQPTKTTVILKNGSICYSLPAGKTGVYLRNYALDFLYIDEAAYVPEAVYTALKPMLAVSEKAKGLGWEYFLSTPYGKGGFFHASHFDKSYLQIHVSSEDCLRISSDFLRKERLRMTKTEYRQEWQGEFTDDWRQFFPTNLIKSCMTMIDWSKSEDYNSKAGYYLGVDIARYGGDENAFVICELYKDKLKIVKCFTTDRVSLTDTIGRIEVIDKEFRFKKIFIDDSGVGGGVTDVLTDRLGKRRITGLNNSSKRVQIEGEEKKKGILKEDLYSNVLMLMETGRLEMISDLNLLKSLKSITYEYNTGSTTKGVKISGAYSHLTEGLTRACWCLKERGLNIYVY